MEIVMVVKVIFNLMYIAVILFLLIHIYYLRLPRFFGYDEDTKYYKIKKDMVILNPISKKLIGTIKKGVIIRDPSFSDAVDLGDSITYKLAIDVDKELIEEVRNEKWYRDVIIKLKD